MKSLKKISLLLICFSVLSVFSQEKKDKIYYLNNDVFEVIIKKIGIEKIEYIFPGEDFYNVVDKKELEKIEFKSGRVQHFNEKEVPVEIVHKEIQKNVVAVLPIPFIREEDGTFETDQKARLAQKKVFAFLEERIHDIKPRTLQPLRTTNALLRKAGIKISELDVASIKELQNILGVQYLIVTKVDYRLDKSVNSSSEKKKDRKRSETSTSSSISERLRYRYTVYVDVYDNNTNIYSKNREPFFEGKNSWQDSVEYILKRMPIFHR